MRTLALIAASALALLLASSPAGAARKPIAGKLTKANYTVIALAPGGTARLVRTRTGRFSVRPAARSVTLHLRGRNGRYAGPVVVGRAGRRAILGVRPGARLGRVRVRRGFARVARRVRREWLDTDVRARARRGVPIGARRAGLVRARGARGPRSDRDLDGIPSPLDIDDDGDRILDNLDRSGRTRVGASQAGPPQLGIATFLPLPIFSTTNVHVDPPPQVNLADWIDLNFSQMARLGIGILPGDQAELDCGGSPDPSNPDGWIGGLSYCVRGGTGGHFVVPDPTPNNASDWPPFPESYDSDGDGDGTLQPGSGGGMFLTLGTTPDNVHGGGESPDLLYERVTTNGAETAYSATLQYVFNTIPALVSYQDGTMSSPQAIPYPVDFGQPGSRSEDGFPVSDGPEDADSDVELTFTFWRPQRPRVSGDSGEGEWMDIGGLTYTVLSVGGFCGPQTAYSTADPKLDPAPPGIVGTNRKGIPGGGFTERPDPDRPANPANTLAFTVNLSECLRAQGGSFNSGDSVPLSLMAISAAPNFVHDQAEQQFHVERR